MSLSVRYPDRGSITEHQHNELVDVMQTESVREALYELVNFMNKEGVAFTMSARDGLTIVDDVEDSEINFVVGEDILESGEMGPYLKDIIPRYSAHMTLPTDDDSSDDSRDSLIP